VSHALKCEAAGDADLVQLLGEEMEVDVILEAEAKKVDFEMIDE